MGELMIVTSFPPNRPRLNLQHPYTHEALRMHSASILLPPLLRLDFPHCVEPQLPRHCSKP